MTKKLPPFFSVLRFTKKYRAQMIVGPAFKLAEAVLELAVPLVMAEVIDRGVAEGDGGFVLRRGLLLVLLGLCGLACALVCQTCAAFASQGSGTELRNALMRKILSISKSDSDRIGDVALINRMTADTEQVQLAVAMLIRLVLRAPFLAVGAVIMAMTVDLRISLIFVGATAVIALIMYLVLSRSLPLYKTLQAKSDTLFRIASENISGARVIRAMSGEPRERKRFAAANRDYAATAERSGGLSAVIAPLTYICANLAVVLILWFGGVRVEAGSLSQGELIALVNYMLQTLAALLVVANLFVIFTRSAASASRIEEVFALPDGLGADAAERAVGEIYPVAETPRLCFKNVEFAYNPGRNVLSGVSFELPAGGTLGIVGGTGAGKSTVAALCCRFYDPSSGSVEFDGVDLRSLERDSLRRSIGLVPQKASLLAGTVADNLRWGNPDADDAALTEALRLACADDFVMAKPDGLNFTLSAGGQNLSGGQRQRLTIARALAGHPKLLILDDSASALDNVTSARLRDNLDAAAKSDPGFAGMSRLIISQRPSAVKHADLILVLEDGVSVAAGKHDELLRSCAAYRERAETEEENA